MSRNLTQVGQRGAVCVCAFFPMEKWTGWRKTYQSICKSHQACHKPQPCKGAAVITGSSFFQWINVAWVNSKSTKLATTLLHRLFPGVFIPKLIQIISMSFSLNLPVSAFSVLGKNVFHYAQPWSFSFFFKSGQLLRQITNILRIIN